MQKEDLVCLGGLEEGVCVHAVSNLQRRVNGSDLGPFFFDVCGHLDMQLVGSTKLFSCASWGEFGHFVHVCD